MKYYKCDPQSFLKAGNSAFKKINKIKFGLRVKYKSNSVSERCEDSSVKDILLVCPFRCFTKWSKPVLLWSYPFIQFYFPITLRQAEQLTRGFLPWRVANLLTGDVFGAATHWTACSLLFYITSRRLYKVQTFCSTLEPKCVHIYIYLYLYECLCALLVRSRGIWVGAKPQNDIFTFLHTIDFFLNFFFLPLNNAPFQQLFPHPFLIFQTFITFHCFIIILAIFILLFPWMHVFALLWCPRPRTSYIWSPCNLSLSLIISMQWYSFSWTAAHVRIKSKIKIRYLRLDI